MAFSSSISSSFKNGLIMAILMFTSCRALREDVQVDLDLEVEVEAPPQCRKLLARNVCPADVKPNSAGFGILQRIGGHGNMLDCIYDWAKSDVGNCAATWEALKNAMADRVKAKSEAPDSFEKLASVVDAGIAKEGGAAPAAVLPAKPPVSLPEGTEDPPQAPKASKTPSAPTGSGGVSTGQLNNKECFCRSGNAKIMGMAPYPKSHASFQNKCMTFKSCDQCTRYEAGKALECCESLVQADGTSAKGPKCGKPIANDFGGAECLCSGKFVLQETVHSQSGDKCPPTKGCNECYFGGQQCMKDPRK